MYGISVVSSGGSERRKMCGKSLSHGGSEKNTNSISYGGSKKNASSFISSGRPSNSISFGCPEKNGKSFVSSRRPGNSISSGRSARTKNSIIYSGRSEMNDKSKPIHPIAFVSAGFIMPTLLPISNQSLEEMIKDAAERKKKEIDQLKSVAVRGRYSGKGLNIMVSQGFQLGTGLGRDCQGILVPIERNFRQNTIGLGFEDNKEKYLQPKPRVTTTDRKRQEWKQKTENDLEEEFCRELARLHLQ